MAVCDGFAGSGCWHLGASSDCYCVVCGDAAVLVWYSGRFEEEAVIDSLEMVYWLFLWKKKNMDWLHL